MKRQDFLLSSGKNISMPSMGLQSIYHTPIYRATIQDIKNFPEMPDEVFEIFGNDIVAAGLTIEQALEHIMGAGYEVEHKFLSSNPATFWFRCAMIVAIPKSEPTITVTLTKSEALQIVDALTLAAQAADCDDAYRDNFHTLKWKFEC